MIVVVWLALIVYTYLDARRRISDPFLVACATVGSFFPYIGTAVYAIVRPPEFLEDAHERELEIRAAELRVRQLTEASCPNCEYPVEKSFLRCPQCQSRLKDPCQSCGKPVDPALGPLPLLRNRDRRAAPPPARRQRGTARATRGALRAARGAPASARTPAQTPPGGAKPKRTPAPADKDARGDPTQTNPKEPRP